MFIDGNDQKSKRIYIESMDEALEELKKFMERRKKKTCKFKLIGKAELRTIKKDSMHSLFG